MKMYKNCMKNFWMLAAFAVVWTVAGCGGDDTPKEVKVTGFELNKTKLTLDPGATDQVNVTKVLPENATLKTYDWKTDNDKVATVSAGGLVTAVGPGDTKLTITAKDGGGASVTVDVHVNDIDYAQKVKGVYEGKLNVRTGGVDYKVDMPLDLVYKEKNKLTFTKTFMLPTLALSDNEELKLGVQFGLIPEKVELKISGEMIISSDDKDGYYVSGSGSLAFTPDYEELARKLLDGNTGSTFTIDNKDQKPPYEPLKDEPIPYIDKNFNMHLRFNILGLGEAHYDGKRK